MSEGGPVNGGGLGSLADELANAWDDDGEGEGEGEGEGDETMEGDELWTGKQQNDGCDDSPSVLFPHTGEVDFTLSSRRGLENGSIRWSKHQRKTSKRQRMNLDEDEDNATEISTALEARLAEISTLAQRGVVSINDQEEDNNIFDRILTHLQDLGSQSNIETSTTRSVRLSICSYNSCSFPNHN